MPPFSIVFVIHDEQDDAVFAGGVGQWLECMVVSITRIVNSLEVVSMQRLHGYAVLVNLKIVKAARGIQFWMPPSSIVFVIHDEQDTVFAGGVG